MTFKAQAIVNTMTLDRARSMAERAESCGFDEVDFTDSAHEPFLPCVSAIEASRGIRVGTSVAIAFARSPMVTAMAAWDLQRFSRGRFVLGLGSQVRGHNERRFSVPWSPPAPRLRDYVLALRASWHTFQTGEPLRFEGKHYTLTLMPPNFNPGPIEHPHIPVHLAAVNPANARVAGEVADGIRLHPFHTPAYLREVILPAVEQGLSKSGRTRDGFEICGGGLFAIGAGEREVAQATEQVRRWLSFYASRRSYQAVLGERWADLGERLIAMSHEGRWDEMAAQVPDEFVHEFAVVATFEQFPAAFRARYEGLVDAIGFSEEVIERTGTGESMAGLLAALRA